MSKIENKAKSIEHNYVLWILIFLGVIYLGYGEFRELKLRSNNSITKGIIYKITTGHNGRQRFYYFYVKDTKYFGTTPYAGGLLIGDTLKVMYYIPDPELNKWIK